ncbi:hypothetical protein BJV74DRAFT_51563 [Russula compacta]|nr:hypothetical protein BJV74DRAFT_51563 [Russula compacta]
MLVLYVVRRVDHAPQSFMRRLCLAHIRCSMTRPSPPRSVGQDYIYSKKAPTRHETADPSAISPGWGERARRDSHLPPCQKKSCFPRQPETDFCFCDKVPAEVKNTAGMPSIQDFSNYGLLVASSLPPPPMFTRETSRSSAARPASVQRVESSVASNHTIRALCAHRGR